MSALEDEALRKWAIEQAVQLHGVGRTLDVVLADAEKLIAFVRKSEEAA